MSKKYNYILHPGWVRVEGDYKWVGFHDLVKMYNLPLEECLNAETCKVGRRDWNRMSHLYPDLEDIRGTKA